MFDITDEKTLDTGMFKCIDNLAKNKKHFDYTEIGSALSAWNVQEYAILQEIAEGVFREVGYSTPKDEELYGHAYDVFRCLDLRGICKSHVTETKIDFHNYARYEIGEDYYIEAMDNDLTGTREFWMCRNFETTKFQVAAFDYGDMKYMGLFDNSGNLIIDEDIAATICTLSDPHEFFYIDNEYNLSMRALKMQGDDELFSKYGL